VVTGYSPVVARTARCLPTSAIVTNCEHNSHRSIEPRTPRRSRLLRSFFCGWPGSFRSVASREFTGQGPLRSPSQRLPTAIARVGSLTPTRLARTPPVAILFPPVAGEASAEDAPSVEGHPQARRAGPRSRETRPYRAASCTSPRREPHSAAPEVPSIDEPTLERVRSRAARASFKKERGGAVKQAPFHSPL